MIVSFCTNEREFLDAVLRECLVFSDEVVVSYGSKLFDGTDEDLTVVRDFQRRYPGVTFVEYTVDPTLDLSVQRGVCARPTAYWHNLARWTAVQALRCRDRWVFVLDADEVPDGARVRAWLAQTRLDRRYTYKCANYWYFKDPTFRSQVWEDSVLLVHRSQLTEAAVFGDYERDHIVGSAPTRLQRRTAGLDGLPMFDHYSWVRSRAGLQHKIANWAHRDDLFRGVDAEGVVNHIFRDENVNDVVHGYKYTVVPNRHGFGFN